MSNELLPCPFCGGEARLYTTESIQSYRRAVVECTSCFASLRKEGGGSHAFPGVSDLMEKRRLSNERAKAEAIAAWNIRHKKTAHLIVHGAIYKCSNCHTPNVGGHVYCDRCGAMFTGEVEQ